MWLVYSFLAATMFGLRGILYQWTSQKPVDRNLLLLGVYLMGAAVSAVLSIALQQNWSYSVLTGIAMGSFSFMSNGAMFKGFAVGKASLVAIFIGLTPLVVVTGGYLLWGESLNLWQSIGFAVILIGIVLIRYSSDLSLKNIQGVQWALLAMLMFGLNDLSSKQAMLLEAELYPTLFTMFTTGSMLFYMFWMRTRRNGIFLAEDSAESAVDKWPVKKTLLWGAIVGSSHISGMIFILLAFKLGITGLVSAITAANILMVILYARIFLKEKLGSLEIFGITFTFAGILLLRLVG